MKNIARIIIALFATQLLLVGFARASVSSSTINQQGSICAMPGNYDDEESQGF